MAPGYQAATAAAFGEALVLYMTVSEMNTSVGSVSTDSSPSADSSAVALVVSAAAAFAVLDAVPSSRRVTARAVHISGATAGPSPLPPVANQDNRFAPRALTERDAVAGAAAAGAAAAVATAATVEVDGAALLSSAGALGSTATGEPTATEAGVSDVGDPARPVGTPGAVTGASLLRCGVRAAVGAEAPLRGVEGELASVDVPAGPRPDRRAGEVALTEVPAGLEASVLLPAEPVVSAKATGIEATAEPTPRATANAPTRPT